MALALCATAGAVPTVGQAEEQPRLTFSANLGGMPGLVDMPSAVSFDDAVLVSTFSYIPGTTRVTLSFQVTERLTASFRYARVERPGAPLPVLYDRSFDVQYRLLDEGGWWPSVAVGLRDFIGTGIYSSEYLVATRHLTPRLRVTGGIGWGRLATHGGFRNPLSVFGSVFETRPPGFSGTGGQPEFGRFFRGDAALFGGIEWQATDRLRLVVEYSSDAYEEETAPGARWAWRSPFNFGASYRVSETTTLTAYALHGATFGLQASFTLRPNQPTHGGVRPTAPLPVIRRAGDGSAGDWSTAWAGRPDAAAQIETALRPLLDAEGLTLVGVQVAPTRAVVRFENRRHESPARAIGRAARAMARVLPASVEEFVLVPVANGVPVSSISLRRSDLERSEFAPDGAESLLSRVRFSDAIAAHGPAPLFGAVPDGTRRFAWSFGPSLSLSFFDPSNPVRADLSLRAEARYALASNLILSGAVTQRLAGNIAGSPLGPDSPGYERVRTSAPLYATDVPALQYLAMEHFSRPGRDLYGRISFGYLERMYAGVSAEILWRPVDSRFALGVEVAQVWRRDPDTPLGLLDYNVVTGHVSAYWDIGNGFHTQIDAGRYLAGDWGATFRLEREFANGWRVGAFATLTDMPFDVYGEGSFDKGITLTIPLTWVLGEPSRSANAVTIRSLSRDGGARLEVPTRLYPVVRELQRGRAAETWGSVLQ